MSIWRRFIDQMFGAPIPESPRTPIGFPSRLTRRGYKWSVRNTQSPRRKSGQGPVERANRFGSPAYWSWQNECNMILQRHHSLPHLHHLRDALLERRALP